MTRAGRVIAVIERCTNLNSARTPSRLELTYLQGADDLARMVAEGTFPFPGEAAILVRSPRVGDGLLRLGRSGRVTYASPNAQSAYRRLGLAADLLGRRAGRDHRRAVRLRRAAGRVADGGGRRAARRGRPRWRATARWSSCARSR